VGGYGFFGVGIGGEGTVGGGDGAGFEAVAGRVGVVRIAILPECRDAITQQFSF